MLRIAAGRKAIAFDPALTVAQLREAGCDPKYFGPGSQGTVFPLSPAEFGGILSAAADWQPDIGPGLNEWLQRVHYGTAPRGAENRQQALPLRGGFALDADERAKIERAAVDCVRARMEAAGWRVKSVEQLCVGYDLICEKGRQRRDVEVKGVSASIPSIIITSREAGQAKTNARFRICIVTNALSKTPKLEELKGVEFLRRYELRPIQFRAAPRNS